MSYGLVFCIVWKIFQEEFFFVGDFDIQDDEEERKSKKVTDNRVIHEKTKRKKDERRIQGMTNEGIWSAGDESCCGVWFGGETEMAFSMRE